MTGLLTYMPKVLLEKVAWETWGQGAQTTHTQTYIAREPLGRWTWPPQELDEMVKWCFTDYRGLLAMILAWALLVGLWGSQW